MPVFCHMNVYRVIKSDTCQSTQYWHGLAPKLLNYMFQSVLFADKVTEIYTRTWFPQSSMAKIGPHPNDLCSFALPLLIIGSSTIKNWHWNKFCGLSYIEQNADTVLQVAQLLDCWWARRYLSCLIWLRHRTYHCVLFWTTEQNPLRNLKLNQAPTECIYGFILSGTLRKSYFAGYMIFFSQGCGKGWIVTVNRQSYLQKFVESPVIRGVSCNCLFPPF